LSTLLICVLVLAAVIIVGMTVRAETVQTATNSTSDDRAPKPRQNAQALKLPRRDPRRTPKIAQPVPVGIDDITVARRIRSGLLLALLVTALGALAALAVGVLSVAIVTGLRQAVG
jgi:hypothetical protein